MATKKTKGLVKEKYTKGQILADIADSTGLTKKQVGAVVDELGAVIERHIRKNAAGEFVLPGLLKIATIRKPATKERKGINPFTGQETTFAAKPARNVIKIRALKALKDMV